MEAVTLEYSASDKTARKLVEGLVASGIFRVKNDAKTIEQAEIRRNLQETKEMIADIQQNGSANYQNMDDFLATLK